MNKYTGDISLKFLMDMSNKTVLIVGGAGYLGASMADALAEVGANIAIADKNVEAGENICRNISKKHGVKSQFFKINLLDDDSLSTLPASVYDAFNALDSIIYAAAIVIDKYIEGWSESFQLQSSQLWADAMQINVTSAFTIARESEKFLKESEVASIVNIISHYGLVGPDYSLYQGTDMTNPAAYAASKGGLLQLTRWLAATMAPDVRVNAITPGGIYRDHGEPFLGRYSQKTLLGRMGREEDFKGAAVYLVSNLSRYVTGHNLVIDGGLTVT